MRDYLLDLIEHTHDLGCIDLIKIIGNDQETTIDGTSEDRSVVIQGKFNGPVPEFVGTFGMPNMDKLKILLNLQEYRENATITINKQNRNGQDVPVGLHFQNAAGDFKNDYRFMSQEIVTEQIKSGKLRTTTWNINIVPTIPGIQRLKMQAQANSEEPNFSVKVANNNLQFNFGDHSTHAGEFVFHAGVTGTLPRTMAWPKKQVISILDLVGDKQIQISDGVMMITVDSGLAKYNYILPAQSK